MMKGSFAIALPVMICLLASCQQNQEQKKPSAPNSAHNDTTAKAPGQPAREKSAVTAYYFMKGKKALDSLGKDSAALNILMAVNRADKSNFSRKDSVVVPGDLTHDIADYLPFPLSVPYLKDVSKIVFFSYPTQAFAAYDHGGLVYTGPTSMGRKKDTTPTGLFFTNWKAEQTTSTFNDEWDLKWNFNLDNEAGIGWHQYALPGYPASHSCLRMLEKDARYMYDWADQWILMGKDSVRVKGTPVIVFGQYSFGAPVPWRQLVSNPAALEIDASAIESVTAPHMDVILSEQKNRETYNGKK